LTAFAFAKAKATRTAGSTAAGGDSAALLIALKAQIL